MKIFHNDRRQLGVSERSQFTQMMDSTRLSDARAYIRALPCFSCDLSSEAKIYHYFCCVFSDSLQKSKSCGAFFCEIQWKLLLPTPAWHLAFASWCSASLWRRLSSWWLLWRPPLCEGFTPVRCLIGPCASWPRPRAARPPIEGIRGGLFQITAITPTRPSPLADLPAQLASECSPDQLHLVHHQEILSAHLEFIFWSYRWIFGGKQRMKEFSKIWHFYKKSYC